MFVARGGGFSIRTSFCRNVFWWFAFVPDVGTREFARALPVPVRKAITN